MFFSLLGVFTPKPASNRSAHMTESASSAYLLESMLQTFLAMGFVVTLRDPGLVKLLIPVVGAACWVAVLSRSDEDRRSCRYI